MHSSISVSSSISRILPCRHREHSFLTKHQHGITDIFAKQVGSKRTLLRLQHNTRQSSTGRVRFYHKDVLAILLHPYFRKLQDDPAKDLTQEILRKNLVTVNQELFTGILEKAIFRPVEGSRDFMGYLRTLFNHILESFSGTGEQMEDALERAFIFHLLTLLNKLETIVDQRPEISTSILERFLKKLVGALRIPFEGEPLSGLQLMGILETRLLDFEHVILLSMNEEIMPSAHNIQSNIPYSLRLAFKMPAKEDKDAIYAYYFYRLLQRAKRVDLLFNGSTEGIQTGEMSRYLHQLIFEKKVELIRPALEVRAREIQPLVIAHNRMADQKLEQ